MSEVTINTYKVDSVSPHPNADKLEIVRFGVNQTCEAKGLYQPGDVVAHFPPDILIPDRIGQQLGVAQYLKSAVYPGLLQPTHCRVGAIRLRGEPSFGFILKVKEEPGVDLTERFQGKKHEPPEPAFWKSSVLAAGHPLFQKYTDIQSYYKYPHAIEPDTYVRFTEKIHGTCSRVALIEGVFYVGTHHTCIKERDNKDRRSLYWGPFDLLENTLIELSKRFSGQPIIIYGEIFGSKIQRIDYGILGSTGYNVFDICINGRYLDWDSLQIIVKEFGLLFVPVLYEGPYTAAAVEQYVNGPATYASNCAFKGREGIVITPQIEQFSNILHGRAILKAVSVDYLQTRTSDSH